jgi:PIN domain nuclease of toxin-antitoxin system
MNCLLDSNAFLWWHVDRSRLSARALNAILDQSNTLALSVASVWEMAIKAKLGKLHVFGSLNDAIESQMRINQIHLLPVSVVHALKTQDLPLHHKDPFDRLLIAQAQTERMVLITADQTIARYDVKIIW